jgi:hypothetical protein
MDAAAYWVLFGDGIIHAIHDRVLTHIKRNSELGRAGLDEPGASLSVRSEP